MRKIRIRIAGVYTEDDRILLVKHRKAGREYYLLPGGGQKPGESQSDALIREWKEELSLDVEPGEFLFCGESVPPRGLLKSQVLQMTYKINRIRGELAVNTHGPLAGHAWFTIDELKAVSFFPACLPQLVAYLEGGEVEHYTRYQWLK